MPAEAGYPALRVAGAGSSLTFLRAAAGAGEGSTKMSIGKPNSRGKKPEKQPGSLSPKLGSPFAVVLLLLVGFLVLRTLFQDAGFQRVPYSRLVERIRSDGCAKVALSNDWVKCYPKPAAGEASKADLPWFAVRVSGDTTLVPLLEQ